MSKWQFDKEDGTFFDADYNPEKGIFTYERAVNIAPVINENLKLQKTKFKMGEGVIGRQVGDIPEVIYFRDISPKFRQLEKEFSGDDLRMKKHAFLLKFLNEHPEYRVVEQIKTNNPNQGNIIVK